MINQIPKPLNNAITFFEKLPGIGPKSAKRLAFYLLRMPQDDLTSFSETLVSLKKRTLKCNICQNLTESDICLICQDESRDCSLLTVVEDVLDLLSFETGNKYRGIYHVLHGRIDPLNYIGPDDIFIDHLLKRLSNDERIKEVIIATNPNTEGEATAMYLKKKIDKLLENEKKTIILSRLAYGLPIGADLEYADYMTLNKAYEGRREY